VPETLLHCGDNLGIMRTMETDSVDLTITSSPYEDARTYGIDFRLKDQEFVDWVTERYRETVRITRGLVVWVIEGKTRQFRWSAIPALIMADLHRSGVRLRKPPIFHRVGIPGSGGPDWLRNDYEFCIASSKGKLPWSDNTACGEPCKWKPGGEMSHRMANGRRVDRFHTKPTADGMITQGYNAPEMANPGNVIQCVVGGGRMGSLLCHENEAPYPEKLVEFFVKSFCPPGGTVFDPHIGSGTTAAVANRLGRNAIGIDVRESQIDLTRRRLAELQCE
jgi:site-specific DNA-methyltransferase (adenine-specific)